MKQSDSIRLRCRKPVESAVESSGIIYDDDDDDNYYYYYYRQASGHWVVDVANFKRLRNHAAKLFVCSL